MTRRTFAVFLSLFIFAFLWGCQKVETRKEKYPSGKLKARYDVTVSKDLVQKNGVYEEWYENKQTKMIVNYVDNKEHGVMRTYYPNGKLSAEIYFHHGEMDGDYREWYESGKKKCFAEYKKGKLDGTVQTWDSQGNRVGKAKFDEGSCVKGDCDQISIKTAYR